ncbi:M48 family metallopeptidase [uncultured Shewanella sp.]|uniref:M48 metallopeptidase family protein n=1 Tax=uncultured Shewanella sp. TaxID=173975 RepID=UPI00260CB959|nr:M48 family metallopeptidase [uncultured Shewanella sp.]
MTALKYLSGYPDHIQQQVSQLLKQGKLGQYVTARYPQRHDIRNDKALYRYTQTIKNTFLRKTQAVTKVIYDDKLTLSHQALGLHSYVARKQGSKIKAKNEIRISAKLKKAPEAFLRMLIVHELAHLKEKEHNKAFYKLCLHMEPNYHQLELDLRLYLTLVDNNQDPYQ